MILIYFLGSKVWPRVLYCTRIIYFVVVVVVGCNFACALLPSYRNCSSPKKTTCSARAHHHHHLSSSYLSPRRALHQFSGDKEERPDLPYPTSPARATTRRSFRASRNPPPPTPPPLLRPARRPRPSGGRRARCGSST
jgi:hypothetical protein